MSVCLVERGGREREEERCISVASERWGGALHWLVHKTLRFDTEAFWNLFCFSCQRTVMILYVNPGRDRLRISHLTFWGKRRESYFDVSDFLPVSHTRQSWTDPYVRLQIPERGNFRFYFAPRSGNIVDPVLLKQLFD